MEKHDCAGPAQSLNKTYELLDYKTPNTFINAEPGKRPEEIVQIYPSLGKPIAGDKVAGLRPQPLPPASNTTNKFWKPKGRK